MPGRYEQKPGNQKTSSARHNVPGRGGVWPFHQDGKCRAGAGEGREPVAMGRRDMEEIVPCHKATAVIQVEEKKVAVRAAKSEASVVRDTAAPGSG